jgi:peptidoglycan-associated lipoprotein
MIAGCAKKTPPPPVAPPPPPPAPTASISVNPSSLEKGGSTQLTWRTENANDVSIEGIGSVDNNGSKTVSPIESTSYRVVAKGPGGSQDAVARVTVTEPPPPPPAAPSLSDEQWWAQNVQDIYFDYDSYSLRADAQQSIAKTAQALAQKPGLSFTVEGHCDSRGSTEYNIVLGDERARAVKDALVAAGVNASRIQTTSFGKEKPFCSEETEACWQQNRRGHFTLRR